MSGLTNRKINLFIALLAVIILAFTIKFRFIGEDGQAYKRTIDGDGKGYYAYLPAAFIYHDLTFSFFDKNPEKFGYQYSQTFLLNHEGKNINKYTCGEAILLIPFFLLALLYSVLFNLPVDGYSSAFQVFCTIGSLFYCVVGLYFTKKLLQQYLFSGLSIILSLLALVLGTNLLNYTVNESSMSHVFSFATVAMHVYLAKKYFAVSSVKLAALIGITLGLIILIRPVNGIIIFSYPFLAGGNSLFAYLKNNLKYFIWAGIFAGIVLCIQLIIWKMGTGNFLLNAYKSEGFYFNKPPHILDYLFSFKRGAFIYSPVLLFSLVGLFALRKQKQLLIWMILFLSALLYIHASWWSWYYGDGFGERPLVDFYAFFALLLAFVFDRIQIKYLKISLLAVFSLFILLHQIFFFQYLKNIIHPDSMNFEKFSYVFLKTSDKYRNLFNCEPEDFYHPKGITVLDSVYAPLNKEGFTATKKFNYTPGNINTEGFYDVSNEEYSLSVEIITDSSSLFKLRYTEISFDYKEIKNDSAASQILLTVNGFDKDNKIYYYNSIPIAEQLFSKPGTEKKAFARIKLPIIERTGDVVKIFIWNAKHKSLHIKNISIKIVETKL